ncbi:hypothetical protein FNO01nite_10760 [Flavobacterium noncentrifugens]|uniref:Glycosyltransferase, GT2 family n=1 Tax=Flavobacterium noncentrifugens TaxID=1128970 RepID=A0A1G8V9M7_9FLAO|nr:glycosyltransferase [Flavobacterium noncentrifugens]GEP50404.1 hypothetical protein FNO01nite_10760 [Flavobacterium noncentrifugens]SDJ62768.1 Glycosyltransferase, GT2 family [Flavobacterium noncentrifugens]
MFSILIATKNRKADLMFTLSRISSLIQRPDVDCVVFDDGSDDGTFEAVRMDFPKVQLLRNESSKGYLFCRNTMLNAAKGEFAISLDDDAHFVTENPLDILKSHFDENPDCGLVAFRILWSETAIENIFTADLTERVKGFVGCGHAWRMKAWRTISNYPEWFEFYGEEDFASLELFKNNIVVDYVPEILVQHRVDLKSRSIAKNDFAFRYRRSLRAGWYLYFMFYPYSKIPRKLAYSLAVQLKSKILKGDFKVILPLTQAMFDVMLHLPKLIKNRKAFSSKQYDGYTQLKETKVYWNPEK